MLSPLQKTKAILGYAINHHWIEIILGLAFLLGWVADWAQGNSLFQWLKSNWNNDSQAFVGWATLFVAIFVWMGEIRENWVKGLPRKLSVTFEYEGRPVMKCIRADLADVGDMRALAQQIGAQMAGIRDLRFVMPRVRQTGGGVEYEQGLGNFVEYKLHFMLNEIPATVDERVKRREGYLLWESPFPAAPRIVPFQAEAA